MLAPFGKLGSLAAAVALAGTAAAWAVGGGAMFSPGALHGADSTPATLGGVSSHAGLTRCSACHAPPWSGRRETMAKRCLDCHTDTRAELRDSTSLHGKLGDVTGCTDCHTEHHGAAGETTRIGDIAHDRLGFSLAAHERTDAGDAFTCRDCHAAATYAFERERCEDCHREYQGDFVTAHVRDWGADCMACHDGKDRFSRGAFDHAATKFALEGKHAKAGCTACHAKSRALADFAEAPTACIGCHRDDDEHKGSMGSDCGECHGVDTWEGARFDHEFPLDHGGEGTIACKVCHEDRANYRSYTCYGCHEHSPARIRAKHDEEGISGRELDDCVRCHRTGREHEGEGREGREGRRRGEREEH